MKNNKDKNCYFIQDLIVKDSYHCLNTGEIKKMKIHLANCKKCREYKDLIQEIFRSMAVRDIKHNDIDNKIRRKVIQHIGKTKKINPLQNIWDLVKKIFEYKIPVNQSVFAFIIIFLLIYGIEKMPHQKDINRIIIHPVDTLKTTTMPVEYNYVLDNLDVIGVQKVGVSMVEDSSIMKFSHPVL